jgi:hypothetical protein
MSKNQEINGKSIRDEIKMLLTSLWMSENDVDSFTIHAGGFHIVNKGKITFTYFNLKQTEQDYMISHFLKYSRYQWISSESHNEGDTIHFGKTYDFVKLFESTTE